MSNVKQALELARVLQSDDGNTNMKDIYRVIDGCGHAVPMEAGRLWREDVLDFLGK